MSSGMGLLTFTDYYHYGIFIVFLFYWTYNRRFGWLVQLVGLVYICDAMAGLVYPVELFGRSFEISQQSFALLALIPIWLYDGRQGYHSKPLQYACYAFYPVHMLVLYLLSRFI